MQEPEPSSRHLHAGRHLGSKQAPPRLIPGLQSIPGLDVTFVFRHVISGSLSLAFLAHTCRAQWRDFPVTLTTTALDRSSSRWFAASACTAAAEGHQANNARLLHLLHSIESSDLVFYIQPPSTFVAHLRTTCEHAVRPRADSCSALAEQSSEVAVWRSRCSSAAAARSVSARTPARAREACATSCCSASRRSRSSGALPDAQARRSRAARGAAHALRRRARVSRAARRPRLRPSRGGRRGGSPVPCAARPPRGRRRRRRVRPGAEAAGLREGR